jgi:spore cortex biosynthesis protein YabQ
MTTGVVYDFFRILRKMFKHPNILIQIEDFFYWIIASIIVFYFVLHMNYGEVRVYTIIGVFLGMYLYFATLSKLIMKIAVAIIEILKKILITTIKIILMPFKLLIKLLAPPTILVKKWSIKRAQDGKRALKKSGRYVRVRVNKVKQEFEIITRKI